MASFCNRCGASVSWARNGSPTAPMVSLDYLGQSMVIRKFDGERIFVESGTYELHRCVEENVRKHEATAEARAEGARASAEYHVAKEAANTEGLKRACPKCGAAVDEPCLNMKHLRKGDKVPNSWPHAERLPEPVFPAPGQVLIAHPGLPKYEVLRLHAQEESIKMPCPKCHAVVGAACEDLAQRAKGTRREVRWPHDERLPLELRMKKDKP